MFQQLIEHIREPFVHSLSTYDNLDQKAIGFLIQKKLKSSLQDFEVTPSRDPFGRWSNWRLLLKAIILSLFEDQLESRRNNFKEKWYELKAQQTFESFQVDPLYAKLTAHFLQIKETIQFEVVQDKSGFLPLYTQSHWQLLKVPFIDQHAEFATLLILLGHLLQNPVWISQGHKAALWHMKNIDFHFKPYRGFLSNHMSCDYMDVVLKQATLFHAASLALNDKEMAYLAKLHYSDLLKSKPYQLKKISIETLLTWKLIDRLFQDQLTPEEVNLPKEIYEEQMPIVGIRDEKVSLLCSLCGHNSSMGTLLFEDLQIVAFGPQIETLGDGKSFGFIGLSNEDDNFEVQKKANSFTLKGTVGIPYFKNGTSQLELWQHARSWLTTKLSYEKECFSLQIKPLRLTQETYFVFYVIADQCLIKGEKKILYQSLQQFQGKACSVSFLNKTKMITLDPGPREGNMKIIPLEGGQSFWGANYLIAYHLNNKYSTFEWKITCNNR